GRGQYGGVLALRSGGRYYWRNHPCRRRLFLRRTRHGRRGIRPTHFMDSLTQAVLGGSITGCALHRYIGRKSVFIGAALATLPDLDVFVRYGDPISSMTYHRGFTHSLFVLSAFAIVLTLVWRLFRPRADYSV